MRVRSWTVTLATVSLAALTSCNGHALSVGSNDLDAAPAPCDGPWDDDPPLIAPAKELQRLETIGGGRWAACPASPESSAIPLAVEIAGAELFPLTVQGGAYVRGPAAEKAIGYNVRDGALDLVLRGVKLTLRLRESPLGITLIDGPTRVRFTALP